jgi:hypothetical protein
MYIYGYFNNDIPKVSLGSIHFLTSQLEEFISLYEKKILITEQEDRDRLDQLKKILSILKSERYDLLMNNPGYVIDYADNNEEYLPSYFPL